jgi:hypothetical protein
MLDNFWYPRTINDYTPTYVSIYDDVSKIEEGAVYVNIKGVPVNQFNTNVKNSDTLLVLFPNGEYAFEKVSGAKLKDMHENIKIETPQFTSKPVKSTLFSQERLPETDMIDIAYIKKQLNKLEQTKYKGLETRCSTIENEYKKYFDFNVDNFTEPGGVYLKYDASFMLRYRYFKCLNIDTEGYGQVEVAIALLYVDENVGNLQYNQPQPPTHPRPSQSRRLIPIVQQTSTQQSSPNLQPQPPPSQPPFGRNYRANRNQHPGQPPQGNGGSFQGGAKRSKARPSPQTASKDKLTFMGKVRTVFKDKNNDKYIKSQGARIYLKDIRGKYKYVK